MRSSLRALAGDIALFSWTRHYSNSVFLHPGVKIDIGEFKVLW